jgi:hypothetical protein
MLDYLETLRGHGRLIRMYDFGYGNAHIEYEARTDTGHIRITVDAQSFHEAICKLRDEIQRITTRGAAEIGPSLLMAPAPETQPGPADDEMPF